MPQREFSIFKGIANHHRQLKDEKWSSWIGTSDDRPLRGILALKYKSPPHTNRPIKKYHKIREKTLTDETVREWLQQPVPDAGSLQAQLKVLICHEEDIKDGDGGEAHKHYHMAAKSFDAAEEYLRLCIQTLPNLTNKWGIQTSEFTTMEERMGKDSKEMTCLGEYLIYQHINIRCRGTGVKSPHPYSAESTDKARALRVYQKSQ